MREACVKHVADAIAACYRRAWTSPDEMRGATGALKRLAVSMANLPLPPAPAASAPADDASGAEAMRDDICKGCSTYEWCSVTGACLADSDPHDEGDWRRVVSTLTALAPLPPTADAVERARREEAYAKTFGQMLARDICESEPSGAVIDAQDRLKGTEAETFLVIDPRDLAEWVQRNVSNAFYDGEITIAAEREAGRDGKGG